MCAELPPELIELDRWGYPVLTSPTVPRSLLAHARRAAQACPTLALLLEEQAGKHEHGDRHERAPAPAGLAAGPDPAPSGPPRRQRGRAAAAVAPLHPRAPP